MDVANSYAALVRFWPVTVSDIFHSCVGQACALFECDGSDRPWFFSDLSHLLH